MSPAASYLVMRTWEVIHSYPLQVTFFSYGFNVGSMRGKMKQRSQFEYRTKPNRHSHVSTTLNCPDFTQILTLTLNHTSVFFTWAWLHSFLVNQLQTSNLNTMIDLIQTSHFAMKRKVSFQYSVTMENPAFTLNYRLTIDRHDEHGDFCEHRQFNLFRTVQITNFAIPIFNNSKQWLPRSLIQSYN